MICNNVEGRKEGWVDACMLHGINGWMSERGREEERDRENEGSREMVAASFLLLLLLLEGDYLFSTLPLCLPPAPSLSLFWFPYFLHPSCVFVLLALTALSLLCLVPFHLSLSPFLSLVLPLLLYKLFIL